MITLLILLVLLNISSPAVSFCNTLQPPFLTWYIIQGCETFCQSSVTLSDFGYSHDGTHWRLVTHSKHMETINKELSGLTDCLKNVNQ